MGQLVPGVRELEDDVYLIERPLGEGEPGVRAVVVVGAERAAVVDTLSCPADMAPVHEILARRGRPAVVVNTHADWDHAWGNGAFAGTPLVGHRLCRARLLATATRDLLRRQQAESPRWFDDVSLVPPFITFAQRMEIDLGGLTLVLHHLPGHTADCLVAHVPQKRLLLAGDCAESPLPLIEDAAHTVRWARSLRRWSSEDLDLVIPSHGPPAGREFLAANAAYLEGLLAGIVDPPAAGLPAFYQQGHQENLRAVRAIGRSRGRSGREER
jgi:glyoxylase-like metal-dependent hydrolase (beta-lactamase superfamily II)